MDKLIIHEENKYKLLLNYDKKSGTLLVTNEYNGDEITTRKIDDGIWSGLFADIITSGTSIEISHNYEDDIVAKDGENVETNGTSNKGHLNTSYEYLVQKLGKEHFGESGDAKIMCEWAFEFKDGSIGTIYNYKNGINYDPKDGFIKDHIPNWEIGGNSDRVIHHINNLLGMEHHNENYKIEFNNYGFYGFTKG